MSGSRWIIALAAAGTTVPAWAAPDHYTIDPNHTYPSFEVPHIEAISTWRGKFNKTTGTMTLDRAAKTGSVDVVVDASSVDTGNDKLNDHIRTKDFLEVETYPTITYKGTIKFDGETPKSVDGQVTMHGVTKPLKLTINSFKCITHPVYKKEVCGTDAEADFNRGDFGVSKYGEGDMGKVHLRIQAEAVKD